MNCSKKIGPATGERLVAAYGCRELIEMGIVDILQTDVNHVGGLTGLWKVAAMANISNVSMAPHACAILDDRAQLEFPGFSIAGAATAP